MSNEKVLADGVLFKKPHENAPDFVKGKLAIKMKELIEFAKIYHKDGWLNLDLLESKAGKYYAVLDTFEPKKQDSSSPDEPLPPSGDFDDPLPF
jgi:hypothetical protein